MTGLLCLVSLGEQFKNNSQTFRRSCNREQLAPARELRHNSEPFVEWATIQISPNGMMKFTMSDMSESSH